MKRSTDHILTSHTGVLRLPGTGSVWEGLAAPPQPRDASAIQKDVDEAVRLQVEAGLDVINDGELGSGAFNLMFGGLEGVEPRGLADERSAKAYTRELDELKDFFSTSPITGLVRVQNTCVGPLSAKDPDAVNAQIAYLKKALEANPGWEEAFVSIVAPSWIQEGLANEYYASEEEFVYAIAEVVKPHCKAVADAGFIVSLDAPDIAYDWEWRLFHNPNLTLDDYRKWKQVHIEANNYAVEGIPEDRVRVHVCWGSWSAPHRYAIPLRSIVDLILMSKAECISIEAAKPNHIHEWSVWEEVKLPAGKILMPGVIDHTTDVREHPEEIAHRIVRYADIVGRENVIAGTDCGMRGHPQRDWIKYQAMVEGAELATKRLWKK